MAQGFTVNMRKAVAHWGKGNKETRKSAVVWSRYLHLLCLLPREWSKILEFFRVGVSICQRGMVCTAAHHKSQALARDTRQETDAFYVLFWEGHRQTDRQTVFSSQQDKKQSCTGCSVRELSYLTRCSGFSFKAHWNKGSLFFFL